MLNMNILVIISICNISISVICGGDCIKFTKRFENQTVTDIFLSEYCLEFGVMIRDRCQKDIISVFRVHKY